MQKKRSAKDHEKTQTTGREKNEDDYDGSGGDLCSAAGCGCGGSFEKKDAGDRAYDGRHREDGSGSEEEGKDF